MITGLRKFTKSWIAAGLFGLIIISFVVVGNTDILGGAGGPVVKAGHREVSQQQFVQDWDRVKKRVQEENGNQAVTNEDLAAQGALTQFLDSVQREEAFAAWAWKAGLRVGKSLVIDSIREVPAFFNQVTGQFDQDTYAQALAEQGFTPQRFEAGLRDQFAVNHYGAAMAAGLRAPRVYSALLANQALQRRDARWFYVTQAMAGAAPAPTDAQLTAFIQENAERLRRPEFRAVSIVVFNDAPGAAPPPVTDAAIQERYDFRRESLSRPETRTFTAISTSDEAAANQVRAALAAGQTPAQAAAAARAEPVVYTDRARASVSDAAVAGAAFGLQPNAVSQPVRGAAGWTVIKLDAITPARPAELAEVRDQIVQELQQEAARGRSFERVEAYEKAKADGANMADAARAAGARIIDLPPFTAEGALPDGQPLNGPPQLVSTVYSLAEGGESEVVDSGQGQYFAVRVNDISPAALPDLAEVRGPLTQAWTQRENQRLLTTRGDALAARIRNGETIEAVAASINAPVVVQTNLSQDQENAQRFGEGVLRGVFGQGRGQVFTGATEDARYVIGRIDAVRAPDAATAGPVAIQVLPRLTQQMAQEFGPVAQAAAVAAVKARTWPERARAALGLPAEAAPAAKK